LYVTVPGIAAPPVTRNVNVVALTVEGFMFSLNVTVAVAAGDTPLKFVGGWFATTVGGERSTVVTVEAAFSTERSETIPALQFAATE